MKDIKAKSNIKMKRKKGIEPVYLVREKQYIFYDLDLV